MRRRPTNTLGGPGGPWAASLGRKHGERHRADALDAKAALIGAAARATLCSERWPLIVAAMTHLIGAYNAGFERDVLNVAEDRSVAARPVVTIQAGGDGPSLSATLDDALICVRSCDGQGLSGDAEYPLRPDRSDDQTAAYVLQQWMERL